MKQHLDWEFSGNFGPITPPPARAVATRPSISGTRSSAARGRVAFGSDRRWAVPYYLDVGTGDSDITWQAVLGLTYWFDWGELGVEWRYLDYDLKSDGPITDLNFDGPAAGIAFRW